MEQASSHNLSEDISNINNGGSHREAIFVVVVGVPVHPNAVEKLSDQTSPEQLRDIPFSNSPHT